MKKLIDPQKTMVFVLVGAVLMIAADILFMDGWRYMGGIAPTKPQLIADVERPVPTVDYRDYVENPVIIEEPRSRFAFLPIFDIQIGQKEATLPKTEKETIPDQHHALPEKPIKPVKGAKIAVIIDDMGMDRKHSSEVISLPGPLTLAFLPYAPKLADITAKSLEKGHELLIHMPMQPLSGSINSGPMTLREDMNQDDINLTLEQAFKAFDGYVGINNHMGSRITQNEKSMGWVMEKLASHNLIFVDSKTIEQSVADDVAAARGLRHVARDVFLDHEVTPEYARRALRQLEHIAARRGYAVAIGHPKAVTIEALKEWLPTLKDKGFTLVPVSQIAVRGQQTVNQPVAEEVSPQLVAPASGVMSEDLLTAPVQLPSPRPE